MKSLSIEILLYILVGVLGAAIDLAVFFGLTFISVPIIVAQWVSALVGATHNHVWHHFHVFTHEQSFQKGYALVMVMSVITIIISGPALLAVESVINTLWLSKIITLTGLGMVNYLLRKMLVFR